MKLQTAQLLQKRILEKKQIGIKSVTLYKYNSYYNNSLLVKLDSVSLGTYSDALKLVYNVRHSFAHTGNEWHIYFENELAMGVILV